MWLLFHLPWIQKLINWNYRQVQTSRFNWKTAVEIYLVWENEIKKISTDDENVILVVDFYARNGTELDYYNGRND